MNAIRSFFANLLAVVAWWLMPGQAHETAQMIYVPAGDLLAAEIESWLASA